MRLRKRAVEAILDLSSIGEMAPGGGRTSVTSQRLTSYLQFSPKASRLIANIISESAPHFDKDPEALGELLEESDRLVAEWRSLK